MLEFGLVPEIGVVALTRYGDFVTEIKTEDGVPWPDEARWEFRFLPDGSDWVIWPATISGDTASFAVDKADVASLLASKPDMYRLFYVESDFDLEYSNGHVKEVS